uniref:SWIM-type domain-containing protein n=1 Tax=Mycena chlorophos TaxID=658473 RepID=A0ABQ0KXE8_MYCCL|nr:predicted protein [Mycena chlorophos]
MWPAWYCPEKYKIWARSTQPDRIGRWRTTMAVENFWRNLKHDTLRNLLHPRLDQLIFLIATEILPAFTAKMQIFDPTYRQGRAPELTPFQVAFKREWIKLSKRALGTCLYDTDVRRWVCTCGQQKYNAYLLCKHLVQALMPPPPAFFARVLRRRVIPFYSDPSFKLKDGTPVDAMDFARSISNGDLNLSTSASTDAIPRGVKRKRAAPKQAPPETPAQDAMDEDAVTDLLHVATRSSSPSPILADEFDDEMDRALEWSRARISDIEGAVAEWKRQLGNPEGSKMWLKRMKTINMGRDVADMFKDTRHFSTTGRNQVNTWPQGKEATRYSQNTMGMSVD